MDRHVLIIDDEWNIPHIFGGLRKTFEQHPSFTLEGFTSCDEAKHALQKKHWFAVVLDLVFPPGDAFQGREFLSQIVKTQPGLPVIVLTSTNALEIAVDLMREGAIDYVLKDVGARPEELATRMLLLRLERLVAASTSSSRILRWYHPSATGLRSSRHNLLSQPATEQAKQLRKKKRHTIPKEAIMPQFTGIRTEVFDCSTQLGKTPFGTELCLSAGELFRFRLQEKSQIGSDITLSDIPKGQDIATSLSRLSIERAQGGAVWPRNTPVVICHALNAVFDSVALYADIGRGFRTARLLENAPMRVLLAGPNWACLNIGNRAAVPDESELIHAVEANLSNRLVLYQGLRWQVSLFDLPGKIPANSSCNTLDMSQIAEERSATSELLRRECGEFPIVSKDRKELQQRVRQAMPLGGSNPPQVAPLWETIQACANISSHLDFDVLTYFLAQAQATERLGNQFLKIAVESEQAFDRGICKRADILASGKQCYMGLYYPQYRAGVYSVLPYSSVSCDLLSTLSQGHNLDTLLGQIVLLHSGDDPLDIESVANCLLTIPEFQRARLISDVMSFLHNMCYAGIVPIDEAFAQVMKVSEELGLSFEFYVSGESAANDSYPFRKKTLSWFASLDSSIFCDYRVPYHLVPFFWYADEWRARNLRLATFLAWIFRLSL
jgi:DNA-binding NarL/FixJ family response regulator